MIAHRRRRLYWTLVRIVLFTALALVVERAGSLAAIENEFYDLRARYCQRHMPRPTDRLVHLDIDDTAIDQIGRWPWDRDDMSEILGEIRLAGPKILVLDILLPDPTKPTYDERGKRVDQDWTLADEIRAFDKVLVPTSLHFNPNMFTSPAEQALQSMLTADPEMDPAGCRDGLLQRGVDFKAIQNLDESVLRIRPSAFYERIDAEMKMGQGGVDAIKRKILPHSDPMLPGPLDRLFAEQYARVSRDRAYARFTLSPPGGMPPVLSSSEALTPLVAFSESARYGAFVDYLPDHVGGAVRNVPLFAEFHGRLVPHVGLVAACAMLEVDPGKLQLSSDSVVIPQPDGNDIVIPVSSRATTDLGRVGMLMEVPMFGKKDGWETMYDFPGHQTPAQHMSVYEIWRACRTRRRLESNEAQADRILVNAFKAMDEDEHRSGPYAAAPCRGAEQLKLINATMNDLQDLIDGLSSVPDLGPALKSKLDACKTYSRDLRELVRQNTALQEQLAALRAELRGKLGSRALFMGGTGSGHVDMVPTALHARCPGVVVHGAIFNAIMTRKFWRIAPHYVTYLIIIAFGLLIGAMVASLSPLKAFAVTMAVCLGYIAFNGNVLFDAYNLIVGVTGPLLVAMLVWSGVTIPNFVREVAERNRITRRFSNYVDPALVNFVIEHPESDHFLGETREMTMGFTDLAGFTTLTESLGTRIVPLLSEYIGIMVPIIRANNGYISQVMGDGIFFFCNAPKENPEHAVHAVDTVLQMHKAVDELNATLPERGYPLLGLRAGICTGMVIVGDAGSSEYSGYTALGDPVNTAARLETANKIFDTRMLVIRRTMELLGGQFLCRPIARLRVAGKTQGVDIFEPLCRIASASPAQFQLVEMSAAVVEKFQAGDFTGCIAAADCLEGAFGETKFSALYRSLSREYRIEPPADFCGQVILTEK